MTFDIALDLFPLIAAVLAAVTCGLLGNFLVLRKQSLMGDAISHAVLPGLVIAFLVTSSRNPMLMFGGAAIAGVVTVVLIETVRKMGRVEPGAAMGVVFSIMFAFGVLMMEKAAARHVDLDADCVLYGQLETLAWFEAPETFAELWSASTMEAVPRQVWLLLSMCAAAVLFITLLFKELRIAAFDPQLATAQGVHAGLMHYLLMVFVAAATVASFEAVGSILVIAMLITPAATARLLTDRLLSQVLASLLVAIFCGAGGYLAATVVPAAFDADSVNAAGSITVVAGLLLGLAAVFSPTHGVLARAWRRRRLGRETNLDDLLAALFRHDESGRAAPTLAQLNQSVRRVAKRTVQRAVRGGALALHDDVLILTATGRERARSVLRKHRLWEGYLVDDAGLSPDHVHDTAEQLEHLAMEPKRMGDTDPHGKPIPRASSDKH